MQRRRDRGRGRRGGHRPARSEPPGAPGGVVPGSPWLCLPRSAPGKRCRYAISSVALGWSVAAGLHLAVGSPLGLPSAAEVTEWIADLHVEVAELARAPRQVWGVEQFTGRDPAGKAIELSVYGRDASSAGSLALGASLHAVGQHAAR